MPASSKMKDQIAGHGDLVVSSAIVIRLPVSGPLETQFRAQLDRTANPVPPRNGVLGIFGGEARTLAFFVVEEVAAQREEVMR